MGSTPIKQSDKDPREDTDPAAIAVNSSDGSGVSIPVLEPETESTDKASDALDETNTDTQELSREEVVALISADDETREDDAETVRSVDLSNGIEGPHPNRSTEDDLSTSSVDQALQVNTHVSPDNGRESTETRFDRPGTAQEGSLESDMRLSDDDSQPAAAGSPTVLSPDPPTTDQRQADLSVSDPASVQKVVEPQEPLYMPAEDDTDSETVAGRVEASTEPAAPTRSTDLVRVGLWGSGLAVLIVLSAAFGFSYLVNRPSDQLITKRQPAGRSSVVSR